MVEVARDEGPRVPTDVAIKVMLRAARKSTEVTMGFILRESTRANYVAINFTLGEFAIIRDPVDLK